MKLSRKTILASAAALLVGGGLVWGLALRSEEPQPTTGSEPSDSTQQNENKQQDNDGPPASGSQSTPPSSGETGSGQTVTKQQVDVTMTTPVPDQTFSGSVIQVRAFVDDAKSGTCILKFTKAGYATIRKTAALVSGPSYYACKGWDIKRSEFPAAGEWEVTVNFSSPTAEGVSATRKIVIE